MRLLARTLALASVATVLTTSLALAAPPHDGCPAGPSGGGSSTIGAWEQMDLATLTQRIVSTGGAAADAQAEFARANKNGDAWVCTMTQILPNDASGSTLWFISRDNTSAAR